jgi:hypothetical protein
MTKLREWLLNTIGKLQTRHSQLARAQRRYGAFRKRAYKAEQQKEKHQKQAEALRKEAHRLLSESGVVKHDQGEAKLRASTRRDKEALRQGHIAYKQHSRAQYWLGQIKLNQQAIHKLNKGKGEAEAAIEKYRREHGVSLTPDHNHVQGGTARQRLHFALHTAMRNCSIGAQNNYYSMSGATPDTDHILRAMPNGHRWDCSTYADGIYICCGLDSPSGSGVGWTGTEGEHGTRVAEEHAQVGDLVLYGPAPHHHVEVVYNPKAKTTSGHGSAPIDEGVYDLFGDGDYEIRRYL